MSAVHPFRSLGAAVIGSGFIGPAHVEALRRLGVPVRGILGSRPERSRQAADALGLERGYESLDALLADPRVQVVHVASPNHLHFSQAKAALEAGKHVLCEKPLAMTPSETAELVRLAAERPAQAAGVCFNIRYYPLNLEAATRLRDGALGRVFAVNGSYVQDWLLYETDYNWRVLAEQAGPLRAVADIGAHWLDLVHAVTGLTVESVCADLATVHPVRLRPKGEVETFSGAAARDTEPVAVSTEDYGAVLLRFAGGACGAFHVSQVTAGRKNRLCYEIAAEKGALAWDSERPNELWQGARESANQLLLKDPSLLSPAVRPFANYPGGHNEGFPDAFKQLFRAFYSAVAEQRPLPASFPGFADGHDEALLCAAILLSARERRWVDLAGIAV
ncbi:MAG: gfo/Idh/MocA family oxidoreductase [Acidobacteria bacterium]|nr:gfo/Idh/MocA family oxidoreductase [Acidobacteriota bacterium]